MSDSTDLLGKIAARDKAAMRAFFEQYQAPLHAFLRSRGADVQTAEDALQDAMLEVWRKARDFEGRSSVKTWLFTIARNKLIDRQRKAARLNVVEDIPESVDDSPNAEAVLASAQDAERVRRCLSALKPHHMTVMRMAYYDDLTYGEIAQIEEIPEGTVKARVHYAKKLLLRCLGRR